MSINVGEKFRVYLENANGQLLEVDAITASVSHSTEIIDVSTFEELRKNAFIPSLTRTEINLVGLGEIEWTESREFVRKQLQAKEWKCEWCGHINPIHARYCGHGDKHAIGCGAHRSFLLNSLLEEEHEHS